MATIAETYLLWFAVAFLIQQRIGPLVLKLIGLPERHWARALPGQPEPACLRGPMGAVRRFALALFRCAFCCGFHAGWVVYLLAPHLPEWARLALISAAGYYTADTLLRFFEAKR